VSTTINPVTQIAEVEVNRASIKLIFPETVLKGSIRRKAPKKMAAAKLMASTWAGWNSLSLWRLMGFLLLSFQRNLVFQSLFVNRPRAFDFSPLLCYFWNGST
jgi:hypothetical protein